MNKKLAYICVCLLIMTVFFTSCQKIDGDGMVNTQNTENATEDSTNTEENMKETDTIEETGKENPHGTDDLAVHKQMLLDTDSICGVIYLGYVDSSKGNLSENEDYLKSVLDKVECARNFDFIYHIAKERFVESDGGSELYCIYPYDENFMAVSEYAINNSIGLLKEENKIELSTKTLNKK